MQNDLSFYAKNDTFDDMNFNTRHILKLLELAELKGVNTISICEKYHIDIDKIENQNITSEQINGLWNEIIQLTKEPNLGLQLGERYNFMALGIVGQMVQNAPTIEAALQHTIQFSNLLTDLFTIELVKFEKYFELRFLPNSHCLLHYYIATIETIKTAMVFALKEYQLLTFKKIRPIKATFNLNIQEYFDYQRIFKCSIHSDSSNFALHFDNQHLDQKIIGGDFQLLQIFVERANEWTLQKGNTLSQKVKEILLHQFNNGFVGIEETAQLQHVSVRTLQRKLKQEQTTFNRILEEVKKDLTLYYLKRNISAQEVSDLLGYQNLSSFSRSFKKWMGMNWSEFKLMQDL